MEPSGPAFADSPTTVAGLDPSAAVGPYRLLEQVGEGGMGEVWLAEQTSPVHRRVALKIIKAGMDTAQVVARFQAERQALALMDHPAIATVFDAGSTPQGRPYFAMEYVKGEPLITYCDRHRLATRERLELFILVCEGVQHAHQKGIIHRDLKPSNVLVTLQGDHPVPKIIDFGVAKATTRHLTDRSLYTEMGVLIGTPEYMSPEQAELTGLDIDTRTDVYALGVLLYELLTGALPFDRTLFRDRGLDEIRRTIREVEAPRPSTRVTQQGPASKDAAARRRTDPARLAGQLEGDLDWVTMKALEKDRTRRYDTVMGLANDVRRHLRHEPVVAGPPSAMYRTRKFVRRHRFGVGAAVTLLVVLVAFAAVMARQAQRIARERDRANREAARANQEAEAARQVSEFLVGLFQVSDPSETRGNTVTAREILDKGAARIDRELSGQPVVQARLMNTMGDVYQSLGLYKESIALLQKSLDVRRRTLGDRHPDVATSLSDLGAMLSRAGDLEPAESTLKQALALQESLFGAGSPMAAVTVGNLAELAYVRGDYAGAERLFRRELDMLRRDPRPNEEAISDTLNDLAMAIQQTRADYKGAQALLGESLQIRRQLFGAIHPKIAINLNNLAKVSYRLHDYDTAEALFLESLAMNRKLHGGEHPEVSANLNNLGLVAFDRGEFAKANAMFEQVLAMDRRLFGPNHLFVAGDLEYYAESLRREGDAHRAESMIREALAIKTKALAPTNWQVAWTNTLLARCLAQEGRFADAERVFLGAYPLIEGQLAPGHLRSLKAAERGAEIYESWGRPAQAAAWRAKALGAAGPR